MGSKRATLNSPLPRSIQTLPSGTFFSTIQNHFLTEEKLKQKATDELNEDPESRQSAIENLRQLILQEDNLVANTSDAFLLRFLRSRKYNQERAFKLVKNYYRAMTDYPSIYKNLVPSDVANVFESDMFTILPGVDNQGRAVGVMTFDNWDASKISNEQFLRAIILNCESLLEEECFQISGTTCIVDLRGFTGQHLRQITPTFAYRAFSFLQNWSPIRFQGFFFVRENALFDVAFAIISPFIGSKLRQRIHFLGHDLKALHEYFPVDILPVSLGGTHDSANDSRNYLRHLMTQEKLFKTNNSIYGYKVNEP